jgi:DNA-binding PadR family transcriptional regulator
MGNRDFLGEFEIFTLLAILRLGDDAYGMRIRQELEAQAERPTSIGALYSTLDRLEQKGLLQSSLGEATAERGGRAKKYFALNPSGRQALRKSLSSLQRLTGGEIGSTLEAL